MLCGSPGTQETETAEPVQARSSPRDSALQRIAAELARLFELHHVVVTAVPACDFGSDDASARQLLSTFVTVDNDGENGNSRDGDGEGGAAAGGGGGAWEGHGVGEVERGAGGAVSLSDPRTAGCVCALLRYLRLAAGSSASLSGTRSGGITASSGGDGESDRGGEASGAAPTRFSLRPVVWDAYMHVNETVIRTLSVFEDASAQPGADGSDAAAASARWQATAATASGNRGRTPKTLYALLSAHCVSMLGPPLLIQWLRKPLQSGAAINERLNVVDFLASQPTVLSDLRGKTALKGVPNLSALCHAFRTRKATLKTMIQVYAFCSNLRHVLGLLADHADTGGDGGGGGRGGGGGGGGGSGGSDRRGDDVADDEAADDHGNNNYGGGGDGGDADDSGGGTESMAVAKSLGIVVTRLLRISQDLNSFEQLVEASVDVPEYQATGRLQIAAALHPRLQTLAREMSDVRASIEVERAAVAKQLKLDLGKLKLDSAAVSSWAAAPAANATGKSKGKGKSSSGGGGGGDGPSNSSGSAVQVAFRITKTFEKSLRTKENKDRFTILPRQKDGVRFLSDRLVRLGERLRNFGDEYRAIQAQLQEKALEVAATFAPVLVDGAAALGELDVLQGFAHLSITSAEAYVRPKIIAAFGAPLVLEGSRHALLEVQPGVECIRNDARMAPEDGRLQVITGPNMGGKSTFIRQIATCVLLAHVGCFVPCAQATIPLVDGIYARVGSTDDVQNGVSTFMAEMLAARAILADVRRRTDTHTHIHTHTTHRHTDTHATDTHTTHTHTHTHTHNRHAHTQHTRAKHRHGAKVMKEDASQLHCVAHRLCACVCVGAYECVCECARFCWCVHDDRYCYTSTLSMLLWLLISCLVCCTPGHAAVAGDRRRDRPGHVGGRRVWLGLGDRQTHRREHQVLLPFRNALP